MIDTVEKIDLESLLENSPSCEEDSIGHEAFDVSCSEDVSYIISACFGEVLICENLGKRIYGHLNHIRCHVCGKKADVCGSVRPI